MPRSPWDWSARITWATMAMAVHAPASRRNELEMGLRLRSRRLAGPMSSVTPSSPRARYPVATLSCPLEMRRGDAARELEAQGPARGLALVVAHPHRLAGRLLRGRQRPGAGGVQHGAAGAGER